MGPHSWRRAHLLIYPSAYVCVCASLQPATTRLRSSTPTEQRSRSKSRPFRSSPAVCCVSQAVCCCVCVPSSRKPLFVIWSLLRSLLQSLYRYCVAASEPPQGGWRPSQCGRAIPSKANTTQHHAEASLTILSAHAGVTRRSGALGDFRIDGWGWA